MAKTRLPEQQKIENFRAQLNSSQKRPFQKLGALFQAPRPELDWYHQVGALIKELLSADTGSRYGKRLIRNLAEALNSSPSKLNKARQFTDLYHQPKDIQVLKELNLDWTMVQASLTIRDSKSRLQFQRQAVSEGWNVKEFLYEIQKEFQSRNRGGGPRRRRPKNFGPKVALRQMSSLGQQWIDHYRQVWFGAGDSIVHQLEGLRPDQYTPALMKPLTTAEATLEEMAKSTDELWRSLRELLRKMKEELERRAAAEPPRGEDQGRGSRGSPPDDAKAEDLRDAQDRASRSRRA